MEGITLKYVRASRNQSLNELGHTDIYFNGNKIGYFMPNRSKSRTKGCNYSVVTTILGSKHDIPSRKAAIKHIEKVYEVAGTIIPSGILKPVDNTSISTIHHREGEPTEFFNFRENK